MHIYKILLCQNANGVSTTLGEQFRILLEKQAIEEVEDHRSQCSQVYVHSPLQDGHSSAHPKISDALDVQPRLESRLLSGPHPTIVQEVHEAGGRFIFFALFLLG